LDEHVEELRRDLAEARGLLVIVEDTLRRETERPSTTVASIVHDALRQVRAFLAGHPEARGGELNIGGVRVVSDPNIMDGKPELRRAPGVNGCRLDSRCSLGDGHRYGCSIFPRRHQERP